MTEEKKANKKQFDWKKKSVDDSSRITKHMQKRDEEKDKKFINNPNSCPPRAIGLPLLRLRKKIQEVYDNEDDEDEYSPFFNISLVEDEPDDIITQKKVNNTFNIAKQQEITGKLNLIMDTALIAEELGLPAKLTTKDETLASIPEYNLEKTRKEALKEKIEKPLGLTGEISEKKLPKAIKGLKKATKQLPEDSLKDFPINAAEDFIELDEEDMAKLILKKSGRKAPKKKLSDIAKGLNQFKSFEEDETNHKE